MFGEDGSRVWFDFAEGDGFKSASSFKSKAETSDAAEKIKHPQLRHDAASNSHGSTSTGPRHDAATMPGMLPS